MVMRYQVPPGGGKEGHMPDSLVVTTAAVLLRKYKLVSNRCRFERRGRRIGGIIEKSAHAMTALKPEEFFYVPGCLLKKSCWFLPRKTIVSSHSFLNLKQ